MHTVWRNEKMFAESALVGGTLRTPLHRDCIKAVRQLTHYLKSFRNLLVTKIFRSKSKRKFRTLACKFRVSASQTATDGALRATLNASHQMLSNRTQSIGEMVLS